MQRTHYTLTITKSKFIELFDRLKAFEIVYINYDRIMCFCRKSSFTFNSQLKSIIEQQSIQE